MSAHPLAGRDLVAEPVPDYLPARYREDWLTPLYERVARELKPGMRVLDVGSGRNPLIARTALPEGSTYAGLDISAAELARSPEGAYDQTYVADVVQHMPELDQTFDLIVSWQVLEHVKPLGRCLENLRSYLRPGGRLLTQFSGAFSIFGLVNMAIPAKVGVWAMHKLLRRPPDTVFPAYYDHCWDTAIEDMMKRWSQVEIVPRYRGGGYLRFAPRLQRLYLGYETWAEHHDHRNLATHYLVDARK